MSTNLTPLQQIYTMKKSYFMIELLADISTNFWTAKTLRGYAVWKVYIMVMINANI